MQNYLSITTARELFKKNALESMLKKIQQEWNSMHDEVEDFGDFWNGDTIEPVIKSTCNYEYIESWNIPTNFYAWGLGDPNRSYINSTDYCGKTHTPLAAMDQE